MTRKPIVEAEIREHTALSNIGALFDMGEFARLRKIQQELTELLPSKLEDAE